AQPRAAAGRAPPARPGPPTWPGRPGRPRERRPPPGRSGRRRTTAWRRASPPGRRRSRSASPTLPLACRWKHLDVRRYVAAVTDGRVRLDRDDATGIARITID